MLPLQYAQGSLYPDVLLIQGHCVMLGLPGKANGYLSAKIYFFFYFYQGRWFGTALTDTSHWTLW
jgi:hypothetical protein